jgi:hypothetical protein
MIGRFMHQAMTCISDQKFNFFMDLEMVELKTIQWTLTCLSTASTLIFAMLAIKSRAKIIPVLNLFTSVVMAMYYFHCAVNMNHVDAQF